MHNIPIFTDIQPAEIKNIVENIISTNKNSIKGLLKITDKSWDNFILPLDKLADDLDKYWGRVHHLNNVANTPALRGAHDSCLEVLTAYGNELSQNTELYQAYVAIAQSDNLTAQQQEYLRQSIRDFKLAGVALNLDDKATYTEITQKLSKLSSSFANNVLDATAAWHKNIIDKDILHGLPESSLAMLANFATEKQQEGYTITLDAPCYIAVMTYAKNRDLREEVYRAYATRASDQADNKDYDNLPLIEQILANKQQLAALLGFANYSEYSIATKMVDSCEQVVNFLEDLLAKSKPQAEQELARLVEFAYAKDKLDALKAWDIAYYSELLKQQTHNIDIEKIKEYFPTAHVMQGLFKILHKLYKINFTPVKEADTWHKDVEFYQISFDDGELVGYIYIDLYARSGKRSGAWMDECHTRYKQTDGSIQLPIAYLNTNAAPASGDKPALLDHNEVVTIFHEMGHCLQHLLTTVETRGISGIAGVPWDAVELASQMHEEFFWTQEGLELISSHYQNGNKLPADMQANLLAAKNFNAGLAMLRQLEFSLFDFKLHMQPKAEVYATLAAVKEQVAVMNTPEYNRFANSFSHIFAGGYAAGYYSYKWAEVLSSDAFMQFSHNGVLSAEIGKKFLDCILATGGSESVMTLFTRFCGHEPRVDSLLALTGINAS